MTTSWLPLQGSALTKGFSGLLKSQRKQIETASATYSKRFEAYCFLWLTEQMKSGGYSTKLVNDTFPNQIRLKFSTRGHPKKYTYVICSKGGRELYEIRHNLNVLSAHVPDARAFTGKVTRPVFCLDVVLVGRKDLGRKDYVLARQVLTFLECKLMSPFPELIAGFIGMTHEVMPTAIREPRLKRFSRSAFPKPTLMCSAYVGSKSSVWPIWDTMVARKFSISCMYFDAFKKELTPFA